MVQHDLVNRFTYHKADPAKGEVMSLIRSKGLEFANLIDSVAPDGREKSTAVTRIEEAVFWANAGIARSEA